MKDAEYYIENPDEYNLLSDQERQALFEGETTNSEPPVAVDEKVKVVEDVEVLAKDGKHTIPYEALVEARNKAQEWEQFAKQQSELISRLQAAKEQDKDTGDTQSQDAVMAEYQGDYPEIIEDMKPYIQSIIDQSIKDGLDKAEQRVKPIEQTAYENALDVHNRRILEAHPDAESLVKDAEFAKWRTEHPYILRSKDGSPLHCDTVLKQGSADQVNDILSAYKQTLTTPAKRDVEDVVKNIKPKAPVTLSEVPSGTQGQHDEIESFLSKSESEQERILLTMTPVQIERFISRIV
jgi:hypothetical protein